MSPSGPSRHPRLVRDLVACGEQRTLIRTTAEWLSRRLTQDGRSAIGSIIVWLEVRVLPAPPRSPVQTEISRCSANSAELVGFPAGTLSLLTIG
jgi:hypothetical protein